MKTNKPDRDYSGQLRVLNNFELTFNCKIWQITTMPLCPSGSLSVELSQDRIKDDCFLLDWHDLITKPGYARTHLYYGNVNKNVCFEEKLRRMQTWTEALQIYNSFMLPFSSDNFDEAEDFILSCHIPKISQVILPTSTRGLITLVKNLFHVSIEGEMIIPWDELVESARSGELVNSWIEQRKEY